jgi:hemerythrin-like domain-containing protein
MTRENGDHMSIAPARRLLIMASLVGSTAALSAGLASCSRRSAGETSEGEGGEGGVSAVEDLMREHGVLRRVLNLYAEVAERLDGGVTGVDAAALGEAAALFRTFGEDYHERALEERFIFPELQRAGGAAGLVDGLLAQHQRGREITDYIIAAAQRSALGAAHTLASALRSMTRMYDAHAAWEDTIVFPAWKHAVGSQRLTESAEQFEDIERRQVGRDGFNEAVRRVKALEERLGVTGLGQFTAPTPPAITPQ